MEEKKKEAYKRKIEAQLDVWKMETEKLKAKARKAKADGEIKFSKEIETLEAKRNDLRARLKKLEASGKDAWGDIKAGIDRAGKELRESIDKAKEKF
ncbi:MAG: hypothetical protein EA390_12120 [Balneolaceae bacterium]|nr:MAG: hypothetical protein EA390_12120 [Balneolaceae bacterium]